MAYKRLAIVGPAALVIDLHIALLPVDVHLPIGPKQGAFTIHMTGSLPGTMESLKPKKPTLHPKFGKIGTFRYIPVQIIWREIHPSICSEDQIVQSPLADQLNQHVGAVSFSLRWCQVDASQHRCPCFDIDVKHETSLPLPIHCESFQLTAQHQCPGADSFRAELPLVESETRRDRWNKVIAQQMIPIEGRVSHISFEQNKKQTARRYYDLHFTIIDSSDDCTNVITVSSQSPAWFFFPKKLNIALATCLQEVNHCDNPLSKSLSMPRTNWSVWNWLIVSFSDIVIIVDGFFAISYSGQNNVSDSNQFILNKDNGKCDIMMNLFFVPLSKPQWLSLCPLVCLFRKL